MLRYQNKKNTNATINNSSFILLNADTTHPQNNIMVYFMHAPKRTIQQHNIIVRRMDPEPKRQKKSLISNGVLSRAQRYQNLSKRNADRQRKERLILINRMEHDEPVRPPQPGPPRCSYHHSVDMTNYKQIERDDVHHKIPERNKRTRIIQSNTSLGRNVMKSFSNNLFTGKIVGYSCENRVWKVLFDDGDEEDFDENDLKLYLVSTYLMRNVVKPFLGNDCKGRVYGFTLGFELWWVRYEDGRCEYLDEDDIIKYMVVDSYTIQVLPFFIASSTMMHRYCHYSQRK